MPRTDNWPREDIVRLLEGYMDQWNRPDYIGKKNEYKGDKISIYLRETYKIERTGASILVKIKNLKAKHGEWKMKYFRSGLCPFLNI